MPPCKLHTPTNHRLHHLHHPNTTSKAIFNPNPSTTKKTTTQNPSHHQTPNPQSPNNAESPIKTSNLTENHRACTGRPRPSLVKSSRPKIPARYYARQFARPWRTAPAETSRHYGPNYRGAARLSASKRRTRVGKQKCAAPGYEGKCLTSRAGEPLPTMPSV